MMNKAIFLMALRCLQEQVVAGNDVSRFAEQDATVSAEAITGLIETIDHVMAPYVVVTDDDAGLYIALFASEAAANADALAIIQSHWQAVADPIKVQLPPTMPPAWEEAYKVLSEAGSEIYQLTVKPEPIQH